MMFGFDLLECNRWVLKQRAKAHELLMYMAYDFHHKNENLITTNVVFDHVPEVD